MSLTLESTIAVDEMVDAQQVGDELILLDLRAERYLSIDPVGARIWQLATQGLALGTVGDTLSQEYAVDAQRACGDVLAFAGRLVELGLVHPVAA